MIHARPIKTALISVYDKSGIKELAEFLCAQNILIISTGGTAHYLSEHQLPVIDVETVTEFKEILDGRVKTLNSRIFAGILFEREKDHHVKTVRDLAIPPIDLVVTNLYPFEKVAKNLQASDAELIENIDIGGPAMLRAAAKNYRSVVALHSPHHYEEFIRHYQMNHGTTLAFRQSCATHTFAYTCAYDQQISSVLTQRCSTTKMQNRIINIEKAKDLRYGENPHQNAAIYSLSTKPHDLNLALTPSIAGKELSYNNLLDAHAAIFALRCLCDYQAHHLESVVVVKHGVPCGAARHEEKITALHQAIASDEKSAFGGIIAVNFDFDLACAKALESGFFEIIIAKSFSHDAIEKLTKKKNLRLLPIHNLISASLGRENFRSIFGGVLIQDTDTTQINTKDWTVVTLKKPHEEELSAMEFAFRMCKATPSNAITIANTRHLLGVGAGQPNRIQAAELAIMGAQSRNMDFAGAALASDAFFPFDDCLKLASLHGIKLIIQPGGGMKDQEIIAQANELGLYMVFTHQRHFKH